MGAREREEPINQEERGTNVCSAGVRAFRQMDAGEKEKGLMCMER